MESEKDVIDLFEKESSYPYIMKQLLEQSFNSIMITEANPSFPIIYVNPAFCELTGYESHEVVGKSPSILQGPKTDQKVLDQLNADVSQGKMFHGRAINYRKDGTEFMMEWKIAPIQNEESETIYYLAIQRNAEEADFS